MIRSIADFDRLWQSELEATQKIFKHLTTASLSQAVTRDDRTLGRIAWHITTSIPEMMKRTGLQFEGINEHDPVPGSAKEIFDAYNKAAVDALEQVKKEWTDATLLVEDEMYGERWARGMTLLILITHQIHHRAQMTVLMRQAGLSVPGVYGPSREEWSAYNMPPPAV
jgi:uncharacterized damage-inducible protein DinB